MKLSGARPAIIAEADWSSAPRKRWMAQAVDRGGYYCAGLPVLAGDLETLIERLSTAAGPQGSLLLGFDFPIGLPEAYAAACGVESFTQLLPRLGDGDWSEFYQVAQTPEEISLQRPFYPLRPGSARQAHLLQGLNAAYMDDLRRRCERAHASRRAAAPLFWTLGGQQVGKAAICGWNQLLGPARRSMPEQVRLWPFDGELSTLIQPGKTVIAETYPGEFYHHLGVVFPARTGKRSQVGRLAQSAALLSWSEQAGVILEEGLREAILAGFGAGQDAEDRFDAVTGLFGMLNVVLGRRLPGEPAPNHRPAWLEVEGWILGQSWKNPV